MKRASFLFVAIASLSLGAAEAHAASRFRPADRLLRDDDSAAWLARNAHVLQSVEYPSPSEDLEPLRGIVRDARLVMLADATHGTHEFYTVKLRMIDFLVREMGFDVIAIEAPFAVSEKLNEYVQGGAVDVRLHLAHLHDGLYFRFWDVEELLDVLDWMRAWNANRGGRPPLTFAGFDISDAAASAREVVSYLESVDPEAADVERETYACITDERALDCRQRVEAARDRLAARRDELTALSDGRSYAEAMQHAVVVAQSFFVPGRDQFMADNVDWLRQNRGESGRMILWAHQEHAGRTESPWVFGGRSLGHYLSRRHRDDYVVIGDANPLRCRLPPPNLEVPVIRRAIELQSRRQECMVDASLSTRFAARPGVTGGGNTVPAEVRQCVKAVAAVRRRIAVRRVEVPQENRGLRFERAAVLDQPVPRLSLQSTVGRLECRHTEADHMQTISSDGMQEVRRNRSVNARIENRDDVELRSRAD